MPFSCVFLSFNNSIADKQIGMIMMLHRGDLINKFINKNYRWEGGKITGSFFFKPTLGNESGENPGGGGKNFALENDIDAVEGSIDTCECPELLNSGLEIGGGVHPSISSMSRCPEGIEASS